LLEHWNTHFRQSSSGPPDRRRRRGVTESVWRRSLPRHISLTCLKHVVVTVPAFQPGGDLGGSRWKPAQTHFQAISGLESWNTHRHSECARLFQCSSSGSDWAASKGGGRWAWQPAGSNRTVARIRSAPPDQIRLVGGPSAGGSTSQHRSRSRPTKLWLNTHLPTVTFVWHTGTLDCSTGTLVPTRVFQTKSSRSALKVTTHILSA